MLTRLICNWCMNLLVLAEPSGYHSGELKGKARTDFSRCIARSSLVRGFWVPVEQQKMGTELGLGDGGWGIRSVRTNAIYNDRYNERKM